MFLILHGGCQLGRCEDLKCEFKNMDYYLVGHLYTCEVTSLNNPSNNITVSGYLGVHSSKKIDNDVKATNIHDTKTKFIPKNLGLLFNLSALTITDANLIVIKSSDFNGMQAMEYLGLWSNKLSSLPVNAFSLLTKLRCIAMGNNLLEKLPMGLFDNNLSLESIYLDGNKIRFIGLGLFDNLKQLIYVSLIRNVCADSVYDGGNKLKNHIKINCTNPNEVPLTPTTQNPKMLEQNEMVKKMKSLEKELSETKKELQKIVIHNDDLKNNLETNCKCPIQDSIDVKLNLIIKITNQMNKMMISLDQQHDEKINLEKCRLQLVEAKEKHKKHQFELAKIQKREFKLENDLNEIYTEVFEREQCDGIRNHNDFFHVY